MTSFHDLDPADRELLEVARRAAREAAEVHESRSAQGREWTEKGRADFVTDVDLEAQEVIVEAIGSAFPDHRIVAEEEDLDVPAEPSAGPGGPFRWVVDPLDGTTNWLHGYPAYAASVAVEDDDGLRIGVVLNSARGELFEAVRGSGARRDGQPIAVSGVDELEMALIGTGFPFKKPEYTEGYLTVFRQLLFRTSGIRRAGSAALDLCDLACGRLDAFWEHWLMPWDVAAGALVLSEAGGHLEELPLPDAPAPSRAPGSAREGSPNHTAGGSSALATSFATRRGGAYLGSNAALRDAFREAVLRAGSSS